jgi:hypothetical protein
MIGPIGTLPADTKLLNLLDPQGHILLLPSIFYDTIPNVELRFWCHVKARYGVPTTELIGWLKHEIGTRSVIEIGSGSGDLCHHLGIHGTDNYSQTFPDVKNHYEVTRQPVIQYPAFVERIAAEPAIVKYQAEVVIGSWVTQWTDPNLPPPHGGGSMYGIAEDWIIQTGRTYILIGNESVHGTKKIMSIPHRTILEPFIRSRSAHPDLNRIWIWN